VRPSPEEREQKEAYARFVRAAVPTVLGAERADAPRAFASWSPEQRALLEEIAKVPYEANINAGTLSGMLAKVGATNLGPGEDDRFLRRYVGLAEPGVLESEVQGRPLWLWLRLCLMGKLDREALLGSVAGLNDRARVELAKRAADNAYQLTRRWPLPGDITPAIEDEDATQLFELLLPVLEPISANERDILLCESAGSPARLTRIGIELDEQLHFSSRQEELDDLESGGAVDVAERRRHCPLGDARAFAAQVHLIGRPLCCCGLWCFSLRCVGLHRAGLQRAGKLAAEGCCALRDVEREVASDQPVAVRAHVKVERAVPRIAANVKESIVRSWRRE